MDTGSDFIRPEFLNILFFQQKNLVVFPYVDMKHLHALEIFTAGYNVVDLESTALHNLKEIIEFESSNSYAQNPTLFFIENAGKEQLQEIMELERIRCIINSNENISDLANGNKFIFFNKKHGQFINYDVSDEELDFENELISNSESKELLQEQIQKIKIAASRIFRELNQTGDLQNIPEILRDYDKKYWKSILGFTRNYYDIVIPEGKISEFRVKPQKVLKDFSDEYEVLISTNKPIGKEFIQLLHEYRSKKVNPQHLELEELYNPLRLYNYLRNHHWREGIPNDFIQEWMKMEISGYKLTTLDKSDFKNIFDQLKIASQVEFPSKEREVTKIFSKPVSDSIPSVYKEPKKFMKWLYTRIDLLEELVTQLVEKPEKSDGIKLHKISSSKIRNMFSSGEDTFEIFKDSASYNAAGIFLNYSMGLETILHNKVSSYFKPLIEKYKHRYDRKETSLEFNKKFGNLMNNKSIALGTWARIMKACKNNHKEFELGEFYNCIEDIFDDQAIIVIQRACEFISRNRKAHIDDLPMEKLVTLRDRTIKLLNSVIDIFYGNGSENSIIPSISDFNQFKSWLIDRLYQIEQFFNPY